MRRETVGESSLGWTDRDLMETNSANGGIGRGEKPWIAVELEASKRLRIEAMNMALLN